jgi:hypothetical protein
VEVTLLYDQLISGTATNDVDEDFLTQRRKDVARFCHTIAAEVQTRVGSTAKLQADGCQVRDHGLVGAQPDWAACLPEARAHRPSPAGECTPITCGVRSADLRTRPRPES